MYIIINSYKNIKVIPISPQSIVSISCLRIVPVVCNLPAQASEKLVHCTMVSHRARQSRPSFAGLLGLYCVNLICPLYGYSVSSIAQLCDGIFSLMNCLLQCSKEVPESSEFVSAPLLHFQPGIVKLNDCTQKRESLSLECQ